MYNRQNKIDFFLKKIDMDDRPNMIKPEWENDIKCSSCGQFKFSKICTCILDKKARLAAR